MLLWRRFRGHLTICHQLWSSGLSRLPRPRTSCACQSGTRIGTGVAHFADHIFTTNFIIVFETFTKFPTELAMRVATGNDWQRVLRPKGDWQRVLRTSSGSSSISRSVSTSRSLSWTKLMPSISGGRGLRGLVHLSPHLPHHHAARQRFQECWDSSRLAARAKVFERCSKILLSVDDFDFRPRTGPSTF